jgi:hypothetical protein
MRMYLEKLWVLVIFNDKILFIKLTNVKTQDRIVSSHRMPLKSYDKSFLIT